MNQTICSLLLDNFKAKSTITDKSKQRYCDCFHKCLKVSTATSPFDVENISKEIVGSSLKNAEMWWSSLESQMNNFVQEATRGASTKKKTTDRKKTTSKRGVKKK